MRDKTQRIGFLILMKLAQAGMLASVIGLTACTGQLPGSFRYDQQEESFSQDINTKIDLLWVVDNSASMDVSQSKLRAGFDSFAKAYLKPGWDIRIGVITTDTYLANAAFTNYIDTPLVLSSGVAEYVQPAWAKSLVQTRHSNLSGPAASDSILTRLSPYMDVTNTANAGKLTTNGGGQPQIAMGALIPAWSQHADYAKLKAGIHDGPTAAFCLTASLLPFFQNATISNCALRDIAPVVNDTTAQGTADCLSTSGNGTQNCVNTFVNNTIRSGSPIISTLMPAGSNESAWTQSIVNAFMINATTGSVGHGSERGLGSIIEFLSKNETDGTTQFFRKGSLRGIIIVSDEEDQTLELPANGAQVSSPFAGYRCDQSQLTALNSGSAATITSSYCCSGGSCSYGSTGTSCAAKSIDGGSWNVSICANSASLRSVSSIKSEVDSFFKSLDSSDSANYFVASIIPLSLQSLQTLQAARDVNDSTAGVYRNVAVDRGDRYMEFGSLVGNGSLNLEIGDSSYSQLLSQIGKTILDKKSQFTLGREPSGYEDMIVKIIHLDGSETVLTSDQYVVAGKVLTITQQSLVLSFKQTDKMSVDYQPKTAN